MRNRPLPSSFAQPWNVFTGLKGKINMYTQHNKFMNKARRLAAAAVIFTFGTAGTALAAESLTLTAGSPGGG